MTSSTACTTPLPRANTPCLTGEVLRQVLELDERPSPCAGCGVAHEASSELGARRVRRRLLALALGREEARVEVAVGHRHERRHVLVAAARSGTGSADGTGSPAADASSDGGEPSIGTSDVEPPLDRRHRLEQPPGVRVLRRRRRSRVAGAVLHRPARRTSRARATAVSATTPRSWVIRITPMSNSRLTPVDQLEDLRLDGHVERGRRLVGDQHVRVVDERHRDHRALAHAARELVRVVACADVGVRDADARRAARPRASQAARLRDAARARAPPRRSASPTRYIGCRQANGSWKIIATSRAADRRAARSATA